MDEIAVKFEIAKILNSKVLNLNEGTNELTEIYKLMEEQLRLHVVGVTLPSKDSREFKSWLKDKNITRDSNDCYDWNGMKYIRAFFFDKYKEDMNKAGN